MHSFVADSKMYDRAQTLQAALEQPTTLPAYCQDKAEQAVCDEEKEVWEVMRILFEAEPRKEILKYLGYDPSTLNQELDTLLAQRPSQDATTTDQTTEEARDEELQQRAVETEDATNGDSAPKENDTVENAVQENATLEYPRPESADLPAPVAPSTPPETTQVAEANPDELFSGSPDDEDVFGSAPPLPEDTSIMPTEGSLQDSVPAAPENFPGAEQAIHRALLVANFEAAVDVCLKRFLFCLFSVV